MRLRQGMCVSAWASPAGADDDMGGQHDFGTGAPVMLRIHFASGSGLQICSLLPLRALCFGCRSAASTLFRKFGGGTKVSTHFTTTETSSK